MNSSMVIDAYNLLTKIIKLEKSKADKQKLKMKQIGQQIVYPNKSEQQINQSANASHPRPRSRDSRMTSQEEQRAQTPNTIIHRVAPTQLTAHQSANIRYQNLTSSILTHYQFFRQSEHSKNAVRKLNMQQQSATIVNAIAGTGCTSTTITTTTSTSSLNNTKQYSAAEQRIVTSN